MRLFKPLCYQHLKFSVSLQRVNMMVENFLSLSCYYLVVIQILPLTGTSGKVCHICCIDETI